MTQSEWDEFLVLSFYKRPDIPLFMLVTQDDVAGLLRAPLSIHHMQTTAMRFVCGYLPKLADILWRKSVDDTQGIVEMLSRSKYNTRLVDNKAKAESADKERNKRYCKSHTLGYAARLKNNELNSRRAWTTCK